MPESHACHACALYEFSLALLELHAASQLESRTVVVGGRELSFETGEVARLADGSCVLRQGGTTGAYVAGQGGTAGLCIHAASSDSVYEEGAVVFILCAEAGRHTWCAHPSVQDAVVHKKLCVPAWFCCSMLHALIASTHCKHFLLMSNVLVHMCELSGTHVMLSSSARRLSLREGKEKAEKGYRIAHIMLSSA
eukprot:scaffold9896_cov18-Tisochrysis_lutea.AAC.2